jgi:predicted regulator of Ras-like GTPase activity (Roadblock/LC7/MglB family)
LGPAAALASAVLRTILDGLLTRPEVLGVAVVSDDGLVIEQALPPGSDGDALAALARTVLSHAAELGVTCRVGPLGLAVLDYRDGPLILAELADGASLLVLTSPSTDLGELLYLIRRHRPAMADLL